MVEKLRPQIYTIKKFSQNIINVNVHILYKLFTYLLSLHLVTICEFDE